LQHVIEFLSEGMKVRVRMRFRGRQKAHKEFGEEIVNRLLTGAAPYGRPDAPPRMLGDRDLNVIISPLPRDLRGKQLREGEVAPRRPPRSRMFQPARRRLPERWRPQPGIGTPIEASPILGDWTPIYLQKNLANGRKSAILPTTVRWLVSFKAW
jgi:hypothetical protein